MKTFKKILCTLLVVVMCMTSAPLQGFVGMEWPEFNIGEWFGGKVNATDEKPTSGQCGENAYWSFDVSTGTLTISGTGATWNFQSKEYPYVSDFMAHYRDDIVTLIVEDGITTIGECLFLDGHYIGSSVINIIFPETLIEIKDSAFLFNTNIKNIRFNGSLNEIGDTAFGYCYELESISGLKSVQKIGDAAFALCRSLEAITGLESVMEIGIDAFGLCYKLKSINLSDTEKIGDMAFGMCWTLDGVDLSSVKEIGEQAFMLCMSLEDITLPSSLSCIGKEAFSSCLFLEEAYVYNPDMVFSEDSLCVSNMIRTDEFTKEDIVSLYVDYQDTIFALAGSEDKSEAEAIYAEIEKHIVEYENPQPYGTIVCYKDSTAETYAIENGINFRYFPGEEPERTIVAIGQCGDNAYYTLYSDGELVISGEGDMWDYTTDGSPFSNIDAKKVTVENEITTIGRRAFEYNKSIEEVWLAESIKTIGELSFSNCEKLSTINVPKNVTYIYPSAFASCKKLESISVDYNNIEYSSDESGVLFNKSKTTIVSYPAGKTQKIYSIPASVNTISSFAFSGVEKTEKINIPNTVAFIEMYAFIGSNIIEIEIPDSVTEMDFWCFASCQNLKSVVLGKGIDYISSYSFIYCENLKTITLGSNIKNIEIAAFANCVNLTDVYFNGTKQEWNAITVKDDNEYLLNATIHFLGEECEHNPIEQILPSTCTVAGMKFYVCSECGELVGESEIIPAAHTPGEWETVIEATYEAVGKKIKKCTVCGMKLQETAIPKLEKLFVEDKKTGIGIEYPSDKYDGKVEIKVEESFDGTAFNILDTKTGAVDSKIYDIKMLVDGNTTQPNGKVTVKIPLPAGYNPKFSFVYYVNSKTGTLEKMNAVYVDGYMVFETDHFSYYAVIVEPDIDNCSCKCHKTGLISRLIWKITIFFNKLLRRNKVCSCGIYHY